MTKIDEIASWTQTQLDEIEHDDSRLSIVLYPLSLIIEIFQIECYR